jgi:DNA-binding HxlR family transcriptional regulator
MEPYQEYAQKIPIEARLAAEGLSGQNEIRWAVVAALIEHGEEPFSGLKEILDIHQQKLSDALDGLQTGGVVKKEAERRTGDKYDGHYKITKFGKKILDGFYEATQPKFKEREEARFTTAPNIKGARVERLNVGGVSEKSTVAKEEVSTQVSVTDIRKAQP